MIKFELPENDMSVMFHIGEAFRKIAIDAGYVVPASTDIKTTVTHAVGDISHTVTTEPVVQIEEELKTPFVMPDEAVDALIEGVAAEWQVPVNMLTGQSANASQENDVEDYAAAITALTRSSLPFNTIRRAIDVQPGVIVDEPVAVTPPVIADDKLDKDGVPWDARIHSRGKTRNVDNTWRVSRAPKDQTKEQFAEFVESVKTELLALMEIPVAVEPIVELPPIITLAMLAPAVVTPPVIEQSVAAKAFDTDVITPAVVTPAVITPAVITPATSTPVITPAVVTPATSTPVITPAVVTPVATGVPATFGELMKFITTNKKLTTDIVKQTLVDNGVAAIPLLASRLDLIPQIHAALVAKL